MKRRIAKSPAAKQFKGFQAHTSTDDLSLQYILSFLRDIGSDGNLSQLGRKLKLIAKDFRVDHSVAGVSAEGKQRE